MTYLTKPKLHHRSAEDASATRAAIRARSRPVRRLQPRFDFGGVIRHSGSTSRRRVAKLSGIGCSSKTPTYFLGNSHGFNTMHGRMPSVLTGAALANRDLIYLGVSGDGIRVDRARPVRARAARRRHGLHRREQRRIRIDEGPVLRDGRQGQQSKRGAINSDEPSISYCLRWRSARRSSAASRATRRSSCR